MYHACTLRGPPAGLEKLTGHRLCPLCPGHTHTASSKRSSSASSVPSSLPRAESQRPSGVLEQVLPISGGVMASLERVNRGARAPWPHHDALLPAEPAAVLCTCTSARRWSSDRAAHLESETVPRMGSVGTFSVVTYMNCLRPTAAELLSLLHIVHAPAHASTSAPPQS